jgi:hypothetical protein
VNTGSPFKMSFPQAFRVWTGSQVPKPLKKLDKSTVSGDVGRNFWGNA